MQNFNRIAKIHIKLLKIRKIFTYLPSSDNINVVINKSLIQKGGNKHEKIHCLIIGGWNASWFMLV